MDVVLLCMFLGLRLHVVKIVDLLGLTWSVANHARCGNCATTYADNQMELYLIVMLVKC